MHALFNVKAPPGTVIYKEKPFAYILSSKYRTEYCDYCFKKGELLKCSSCKSVYYCDKTCQKHGWIVHKKECNLLSKAAPRIVPDAARLLHRLMKKLQDGGANIESYYTNKEFRKWGDLMSHYTELKKDIRRLEHVTTLYGLLISISDEPLLPFNDILDIYGKMCINSFNICNPELENLGTGIYLGASIIDHSCDPNAIAIFEGTKIIIRTVKELPIPEWSCVRISYLDLLASTQERQQILQETYYFHCDCEKCKKPEDKLVMFGMLCPNINCGNLLDPNNPLNDQVVCQKCKRVASQDYIDDFNDTVEFTQLQLDNMKNTTYLDACKVCLRKQEKTFSKLHLKRIKILDSAFESSIDLEAYDDALRFGIDLIDAYKYYYPKYHPLTGLLHIKLYKLLSLKNRLNDAVKHLKDGAIILNITHGRSSSIYRGILPAMKHYRSFADIFGELA